MTADIWIVTDAAGFIRECSPAALELLGYSSRGARHRDLPTIFLSDRPRLSELLAVAAGGTIVERKARLRPNDRRSVDVHFRIERYASEQPEPLLLWTLTLRWPITLRIPRGVDGRQLITVWRAGEYRCVFVPGGADKRRLLVCEQDAVVLEETPADVAAALARAAELQRMVVGSQLPQRPSVEQREPH